MSEPQKDGGAAPNAIIGDDPAKNVKDTAFESVKAEKKAIQEENAKLKLELGKIQEEKRIKEDEALKAKGEYKTLWEQSEAEKKELASKLSVNEKEKLNLRKIDVVMRELGAPLEKPEYWNFVDLSRIPFDEATGDIDRNIAKQVASDFVKTYPELVKVKGGRLPGNAPAPAINEPLTYDKWLALPLNEKKKRQQDVKL